MLILENNRVCGNKNLLYLLKFSKFPNILLNLIAIRKKFNNYVNNFSIIAYVWAVYNGHYFNNQYNVENNKVTMYIVVQSLS